MAATAKTKPKKQKSLPFIQRDAAGIDIGLPKFMWLCPRMRDIRPVRKFRHNLPEDFACLGPTALIWLFNQKR